VEHPSTAQRTKRDAGITAAIFGFFAMAWFGWAQAEPPDLLGPWLIAGSIASLLTLVAGVAVTVRHRRDGSAMRDAGTNRRYGIIVGAESAVAGVGAGILGATGVPDYIPVWIGAVVGVHFFLLAPVLRDRSLHAVGAAVCAVVVAGLVAGLTGATAPTTVVGAGAGLVLLIAGVVSLLRHA
jgi:hypothetical protein